jgi:NNP family nitrate/nitrite transporter-like MFS transporter
MSTADESGLSPYRWVILAIAMLGTFIGSYAQFQLPPLAYKLMPALNLSPSQFSALMAGPMTGSLFICILGGALADRFGVKKVVAVGFFFSVIGCYFRSVTDSFWPFLLMTVLAGLASGLLVGNLAKLFGAWFPQRQMGTIMGACMISPALAMFAGTSTTALFPSMSGAFIFSGVLCLVIFILWMVFAKNRPEGAVEPPVLRANQYLGRAARSRGVWLAGCSLFFVMGSVMVFSSFLPNVLQELRGISAAKASLFASMLTLGGIFGCFIGPMICSRMGVMRRYLIIVGLLSGVAIFWSWQLPMGSWLVAALLLTGFLQYSVQPLFSALPMLLPDIGPVYAGSAGGIIATVQVLGAVVVPTFIITPLAGTNTTMLFGLAAICMVLMTLPVFFLPEVGARALAARAVPAPAPAPAPVE